MIPRIIHVQALSDYRLEIRFADGTAGVVSLKDRLFGPVFEPLKDPAVFAQAKVDEYGAVCWPNGADLTPDALYEAIRTRSHVA